MTSMQYFFPYHYIHDNRTTCTTRLINKTSYIRIALCSLPRPTPQIPPGGDAVLSGWLTVSISAWARHLHVWRHRLGLFMSGRAGRSPSGYDNNPYHFSLVYQHIFLYDPLIFCLSFYFVLLGEITEFEHLIMQHHGAIIRTISTQITRKSLYLNEI